MNERASSRRTREGGADSAHESGGVPHHRGHARGGAPAADPICAARPGKSTPACTVPAGHWQIETGLADWTLQRAGGERDTSIVIGETTVKYGLTGRSDIEVDVTPWQRATSRGPGFRDHASGIGDVTVAYKQLLAGNDAPCRSQRFPIVKIPTAKHSLGNRKWEGGLLIPIAYSIPKSPLSIGLTPELDWVADADGHGHHPANGPGREPGLAGDRQAQSFGRTVGPMGLGSGGRRGKQASADGSIAYLLSDNVQIDGGANFGLNRQTPDVELYAGVSKRF